MSGGIAILGSRTTGAALFSTLEKETRPPAIEERGVEGVRAAEEGGWSALSAVVAVLGLLGLLGVILAYFAPKIEAGSGEPILSSPVAEFLRRFSPMRVDLGVAALGGDPEGERRMMKFASFSAFLFAGALTAGGGVFANPPRPARRGLSPSAAVIAGFLVFIAARWWARVGEQVAFIWGQSLPSPILSPRIFIECAAILIFAGLYLIGVFLDTPKVMTGLRMAGFYAAAAAAPAALWQLAVLGPALLAAGAPLVLANVCGCVALAAGGGWLLSRDATRGREAASKTVGKKLEATAASRLARRAGPPLVEGAGAAAAVEARRGAVKREIWKLLVAAGAREEAAAALVWFLAGGDVVDLQGLITVVMAEVELLKNADSQEQDVEVLRGPGPQKEDIDDLIYGSGNPKILLATSSSLESVLVCLASLYGLQGVDRSSAVTRARAARVEALSRLGSGDSRFSEALEICLRGACGRLDEESLRDFGSSVLNLSRGGGDAGRLAKAGLRLAQHFASSPGKMLKMSTLVGFLEAMCGFFFQPRKISLFVECMFGCTGSTAGGKKFHRMVQALAPEDNDDIMLEKKSIADDMIEVEEGDDMIKESNRLDDMRRSTDQDDDPRALKFPYADPTISTTPQPLNDSTAQPLNPSPPVSSPPNEESSLSSSSHSSEYFQYFTVDFFISRVFETLGAAKNFGFFSLPTVKRLFRVSPQNSTRIHSMLRLQTSLFRNPQTSNALLLVPGKDGWSPSDIKAMVGIVELSEGNTSSECVAFLVLKLLESVGVDKMRECIELVHLIFSGDAELVAKIFERHGLPHGYFFAFLRRHPRARLEQIYAAFDPDVPCLGELRARAEERRRGKGRPAKPEEEAINHTVTSKSVVAPQPATIRSGVAQTSYIVTNRSIVAAHHSTPHPTLSYATSYLTTPHHSTPQPLTTQPSAVSAELSAFLSTFSLFRSITQRRLAPALPLLQDFLRPALSALPLHARRGFFTVLRTLADTLSHRNPVACCSDRLSRLLCIGKFLRGPAAKHHGFLPKHFGLNNFGGQLATELVQVLQAAKHRQMFGQKVEMSIFKIEEELAIMYFQYFIGSDFGVVTRTAMEKLLILVENDNESDGDAKEVRDSRGSRETRGGEEEKWRGTERSESMQLLNESKHGEEPESRVLTHGGNFTGSNYKETVESEFKGRSGEGLGGSRGGIISGSKDDMTRGTNSGVGIISGSKHEGSGPGLSEGWVHRVRRDWRVGSLDWLSSQFLVVDSNMLEKSFFRSLFSGDMASSSVAFAFSTLSGLGERADFPGCREVESFLWEQGGISPLVFHFLAAEPQTTSPSSLERLRKNLANAPQGRFAAGESALAALLRPELIDTLAALAASGREKGIDALKVLTEEASIGGGEGDIDSLGSLTNGPNNSTFDLSRRPKLGSSAELISFMLSLRAGCAGPPPSSLGEVDCAEVERLFNMAFRSSTSRDTAGLTRTVAAFLLAESRAKGSVVEEAPRLAPRVCELEPPAFWAAMAFRRKKRELGEALLGGVWFERSPGFRAGVELLRRLSTAMEKRDSNKAESIEPAPTSIEPSTEMADSAQDDKLLDLVVSLHLRRASLEFLRLAFEAVWWRELDLRASSSPVPRSPTKREAAGLHFIYTRRVSLRSSIAHLIAGGKVFPGLRGLAGSMDAEDWKALTETLGVAAEERQFGQKLLSALLRRWQRREPGTAANFNAAAAPSLAPRDFAAADAGLDGFLDEAAETFLEVAAGLPSSAGGGGYFEGVVMARLGGILEQGPREFLAGRRRVVRLVEVATFFLERELFLRGEKILPSRSDLAKGVLLHFGLLLRPEELPPFSASLFSPPAVLNWMKETRRVSPVSPLRAELLEGDPAVFTDEVCRVADAFLALKKWEQMLVLGSHLRTLAKLEKYARMKILPMIEESVEKIEVLMSPDEYLSHLSDKTINFISDNPINSSPNDAAPALSDISSVESLSDDSSIYAPDTPPVVYMFPLSGSRTQEALLQDQFDSPLSECLGLFDPFILQIKLLPFTQTWAKFKNIFSEEDFMRVFVGVKDLSCPSRKPFAKALDNYYQVSRVEKVVDLKVKHLFERFPTVVNVDAIDQDSLAELETIHLLQQCRKDFSSQKMEKVLRSMRPPLKSDHKALLAIFELLFARNFERLLIRKFRILRNVQNFR